jgi:hypothetical protein
MDVLRNKEYPNKMEFSASMKSPLLITKARTGTFKFFKKKRVRRTLVALVVLYASFAGLIWWSMRQPPETFARVMARMPGPVPFLIFPFETAWLRARAGQLHPGDPAPDFNLIKQDKSARVQLAALAARGPVVLVFGSYT